jgi:hypothetical protein
MGRHNPDLFLQVKDCDLQQIQSANKECLLQLVGRDCKITRGKNHGQDKRAEARMGMAGLT